MFVDILRILTLAQSQAYISLIFIPFRITGSSVLWWLLWQKSPNNTTVTSSISIILSHKSCNIFSWDYRTLLYATLYLSKTMSWDLLSLILKFLEMLQIVVSFVTKSNGSLKTGRNVAVMPDEATSMSSKRLINNVIMYSNNIEG